MPPLRRAIILGGLLTLGACIFLAGIGWGLPSSRVDSFLFGTHQAWSGKQVLELSPVEDDPARGADVDRNPIVIRDTPIILNGTDGQRAEIIRRYRLFTYQPDEMITLMALAQMRPAQGDLDPRLYQYGGLWVYGVGALLRVADMVGYVNLRPDLAFYLDHPEQFGRFYIVARVYSALWGLLGIWAVHRLTRFFTLRPWAPTIASLCYLLMPVVISGAHEAKPHLAGAVLMLLAIIPAIHFLQGGQARGCIAAGILSGAAVGMVLSAWPIVVVIPLMALLRSNDPARRRLQAFVAAGLLCAITYFVTNPYVAINLVGNRALLFSNLSNTTGMYGISIGGIVNGALLIAEGMSPALAIYGAVGALALALWARRGPGSAEEATARDRRPWLLIAPAAIVLVQFLLAASGKPAEFGRFFLLPDIVLALAAVVSIDRLTPSPMLRMLSYTFVTMTLGVFGLLYERAFLRDASALPGRVLWADQLDQLSTHGAQTLGVYAEPAPYSLPPVDLWAWQLILLPEEGDWGAMRPDVVIRAADTLDDPSPPAPGYTLLPDVHVRQPIVPKITWADKPFEVWIHQPRAPADDPIE